MTSLYGGLDLKSRQRNKDQHLSNLASSIILIRMVLAL